MNFLIKTYDGRCLVRPDISLNRDGDTYYVPDGVTALYVAPIAFMRLAKTGKVVGGQFAARYYDAVGFGALLYPSMAEDKSINLAEASCFDQSSFFPQPFFNPLTIEKQDNEFVMALEGTSGFRTDCTGIKSMLEQALVDCSRHSLARVGDFVAVELQPMEALVLDSSIGESGINMEFCGNQTLQIAIKF